MRLSFLLGSLLLFTRLDHLFASKSQCADKEHTCPSARPTQCTKQYEPVCGYFKDGCPEGLCPKTLGNACEACADKTVVYYTSGTCKQESVSCLSALFSNPCPETLDPVCAKPDGGSPTTYKNACFGCGQAASSWQKPGACTEDTFSCATALFPPECPKSVSPVCVTAADGSETTYTNECLACQGNAGGLIKRGACAKDTFSCALALFAPDCPKTVDPVCAVQADGNEVTYNNACLACQGDAGSLIKLGACQTDTFSCATALFSPNCPKTLSAVCSVKENGKETTYNNECLACKGDAGSLIKIGACPSDTFSCALALFTPKCPNSPHPVCGVSASGKQTTYKNECFACQKAAGNLIKVGACGKN